MFAGEFLCYLFYKAIYCILRRRNVSLFCFFLAFFSTICFYCFQDGSEDTNLLTSGDREFKPINMLLPAFLDAISTILLLTGLYLTYVSSFQMIRSKFCLFNCLITSELLFTFWHSGL